VRLKERFLEGWRGCGGGEQALNERGRGKVRGGEGRCGKVRK